MPGFRERLRDLPMFPDGLPEGQISDPHAAPPTPHDLFTAWFDDAVAVGAHAPHAMTLSTAGSGAVVDARTVLLTDLDAGGWWFAGHATSPKGRHLAENPQAALTFLWREVGRQVRVAGTVSSHPDVGVEDFRRRSDASRATGLVDHQSEVLDDLAEHREAWAEALQEVRADPRRVPSTWTAWRLSPSSVEFWQTGAGTGQTRLRYRRGTGPTAWTTELLWP
ncbi:pyridoxal 5'-phosphate synthase [Isoptericola sp. AK164]|uniref:pyridoxine/pyridoxamine 5'-phosphate oxidase n=1 Tax=Isoptericola sp. AK164 TaxID=3024246 RepID=UPI002418A021|nr:pyridoxal 5'-phosphate synthase [Isoptericola sp. AK164]